MSLAVWARCLLADLDARRPWRSFVPPDELTPEQAYALQGEVARLREDRGERIIGYKIGCTSRAIQDQLGIREPIFARVFDTGCFPPASRLGHARFANLAIEGELAIRLSEDLPHGPLSDGDYVGAVESVFPVIELHHYDLPVEGRPVVRADRVRRDARRAGSRRAGNDGFGRNPFGRGTGGHNQ